MQEVGHFGVIFFIAFIWIISIFITIANFYYFNQVYDQGGTPDYSSDSAYNICIFLGFSLGFQILCFVCVFYVIYEEYQRSSEKGQKEIELERYKASINAINTTYSQTSKDVSQSLKKQLDSQVSKITNQYIEKEQTILERENEIRQKLSWVRTLYDEQKEVREQLDKTKKELEQSKNQINQLKNTVKPPEQFIIKEKKDEISQTTEDEILEQPKKEIKSVKIFSI